MHSMINMEIKIQNMFGQLSASEQKVASFLLNNMDSLFSMPIADLAQASGVSQVAWVRFCKKMGYSGLKDFKSQLFLELSEGNDNENSTGLENSYTDIKDFINVAQIIQHVSDASMQAIAQTAQLLDPVVLEMVATSIINAKNTWIFGVGASGLVGADLFSKLIRINLPALFCSDFHIQLTYGANMSKKDVAVIISYSGETPELLEVVKLARAQGTKIIAITQYGKSTLSSQSDLVLFLIANEKYRRSGAMNSRMAQLLVIDILFTRIANKEYPKIEKKLENSFQSCYAYKKTKQKTKIN